MPPARYNLDVERRLDHYRTMARIRAFEDTAARAQAEGYVGGAVHRSIGQEAVASGVCVTLVAKPLEALLRVTQEAILEAVAELA